jgi:Xaa-Pro aminopeptidase
MRILGWINSLRGRLGLPSPAAEDGDALIREGDLVSMFVGVAVGGVESRGFVNFVGGQPSKEQKAAHDALLKVVQKCLEEIRPGASLDRIDRVARRHLTDLGYGDHGYWTFGDALLLAHTGGGWVNQGQLDRPKLEKNMVISLEPSVKVPSINASLVLPTKRGTKTIPDILKVGQLLAVTEESYELLSEELQPLEAVG